MHDLVKDYKELRTNERISIKKLSEKSGVNKQTIENWEYLSKNPSLESFCKVVEALGYSVEIKKVP